MMRASSIAIIFAFVAASVLVEVSCLSSKQDTNVHISFPFMLLGIFMILVNDTLSYFYISYLIQIYNLDRGHLNKHALFAEFINAAIFCMVLTVFVSPPKSISFVRSIEVC
jgi:hypothetical protein